MNKLISQSLGLADKHGEGPNELKIGMIDHQHRKHLIFPFMKLRLMISVSVEKTL